MLWERTKNRDVNVLHVSRLSPSPTIHYGTGTSQILQPSGCPTAKSSSLRPANGEETYRLDELNLAAACRWRIGVFVGRSPSFRKSSCSEWCPFQHVFQALGGAWLFRHMCLVFVSFTGHLELGPTMTYSFFLYSVKVPAWLLWNRF